jgi:hypothetical protein
MSLVVGSCVCSSIYQVKHSSALPLVFSTYQIKFYFQSHISSYIPFHVVFSTLLSGIVSHRIK